MAAVHRLICSGGRKSFPRLLLIARDIHPRTKDALRFLADNGLPVTVIRVSLYQDEAGRHLVDIEREAEVTVGATADQGAGPARSQRTYRIHGRPVRIIDLVQAGLLQPGTEIALTRGGTTGRAVISENGTIRVGRTEYATPSAAGKPIVGDTVDGWVTWRIPSLGNRSLADLRSELLDRQAE